MASPRNRTTAAREVDGSTRRSGTRSAGSGTTCSRCQARSRAALPRRPRARRPVVERSASVGWLKTASMKVVEARRSLRALPNVRGGPGLVSSLRPHAPLVCSPAWKMIGLPMAIRASKNSAKRNRRHQISKAPGNVGCRADLPVQDFSTITCARAIVETGGHATFEVARVPLNYVTVFIGNITSSDYSIDAADVVVFQPTVGLNHLSVFRSLFLLPPLDVTQVLLLKACLSLTSGSPRLPALTPRYFALLPGPALLRLLTPFACRRRPSGSW